jgi:hypothetical protein
MADDDTAGPQKLSVGSPGTSRDIIVQLVGDAAANVVGLKTVEMFGHRLEISPHIKIAARKEVFAATAFAYATYQEVNGVAHDPVNHA